MKIYAPDIDAVMKLRNQEKELKSKLESDPENEALKADLEDLQEEILSYAAEEEDDGMDRDF